MGFPTGSSGAGAGSSDTKESTQLLVKTAVEAINTATGTVTANPAANTTLGRLKDIYTAITSQLPAALTGSGSLKSAIVEAIAAGSNIIGKVGIDQTTDGTTNAVFVKSTGHSATVNITRPSDTTAYAAGDVIGDTGGSAIFTFSNMARAAGDIIITSVELEIDASSVPSGMTGFNLRLYNASPTAIADNAAWDLPSGDRGKYLGKISLGTPVDEGSTLFIDNDNIGKQITLTSTNLYVELQTVGAFTPSSATVKRLTIHTMDV